MNATADEFFVIETEYAIKYTNERPVPIPEVISSLQNLERLIRRTPAFIELAYKGIRITEVDVFVVSLETGSLTQKFLIKYVFKGQDNYEKAKEVFERIMEDNSVVKTVVAMSVGGLITYGVIQALGPSAPATHIEAYNNNIINVGGSVDLKGEDINMLLEAITDKKQLAKEAVNVVRPAKADPEAKIEITGFDALTIDKKYIAQAPEEYSPPVPEEKDEKYSNVELVIFASDRDKTESGWAGIVPGVVDTRVKFSLGEGVDPKNLHGRIRVRADITVVSRFNKSKKAYEAKSVDIVRVQ